MDALNPFKLAAFWTGMALGIPMLASELAAEVWGTRSKPAPVPAEKPAVGMTRRVEDIQTRFSTAGIEDVQTAYEDARDELVAMQGAKLAKSTNIATRLHGELMLAKVASRRAKRKGKA
jgi:hypothetical protein